MLRHLVNVIYGWRFKVDIYFLLLLLLFLFLFFFRDKKPINLQYSYLKAERIIYSGNRIVEIK